ncbi:thermonuclease family protein [Paracoccaceae bacterium]|nr:thermonuclease family protein [Paracoccaceae bacterium]
MKYVLALIFILLANFAFAHSGGLDRNGCHSGSQKYHCHKKINKSELPKPGTLLEGQVTHVRDGDTIEVNGVAIRLSALDCPERGTRGGEHANRLAQQFLNTKAVCELTDAKTYERLVGYCSIENQDFGLFMMLNSACKLWKKYDVWGRY